MKNTSSFTLLLVAIAFAGFIGGVFFGRITVKPHSPDAIEPPATEIGTASIIDSKLNINTASADELTLLPGIGEVLAQRIVAYRDEVGAYISTDQLLEVNGIGTAKLNAIKQYITVGG